MSLKSCGAAAFTLFTLFKALCRCLFPFPPELHILILIHGARLSLSVFSFLLSRIYGKCLVSVSQQRRPPQASPDVHHAALNIYIQFSFNLPPHLSGSAPVWKAQHRETYADNLCGLRISYSVYVYPVILPSGQVKY